MNSADVPPSIADFLRRAVADRGHIEALGSIRNGELRWRTWREVFDDASRLAASLQSAGIEPGDRVAQVSENRYEWIVVDLALHLISAVHVPIHVTLSGEQIAQQITDSGARIVFASTGELLEKFVRNSRDVPFVIHDETDYASQPPALPGVRPTANVKEAEPPAEPGAEGPTKTHRLSPSPQPLAPSPHSLATILYTSGTTGRPRGVMLSQQNLASNAAALSQAFNDDVDQTRLCILPLSHIYARTCDLYTWLHSGCRLVLAESRETLGRDFQLVRPTTFNAVPYVYQRIADAIRSAGDDETTEAANLHAYFGGRIEVLCCGGAPIAPDVEKWFTDRGLPVRPGYGLTEASPVIAASTPEAYRFGAVGPAVPGVEIRIAEDGEILTRGPHVMLGYWNDPAATAAVIRDGWLHTGDFGQLDSDGFLKISGRKKELIVLSTGKKVHPSRVESLLTASPLIEQAAVFGDGQPCLVALIVPAARITTNESIGAEISRCLQSAAHEEHVRNFKILSRPFSIERGELTAKLSLCRDAIARNFASELQSLRSQNPAISTGENGTLAPSAAVTATPND